MKAHYPAEFFAVKLTTEKNDNKFINLIKDAKIMGFEILPPDVNRSDVGFIIEGDKEIRFGIGRIKGVGEEAAKAITEARKDREFRGIQDFVSRVDGRKVNKKVLECLIKAGAFDFTGTKRDELLERLSSSGKNMSSLAQNSLFGGTQKKKKIDINDILRMEKEVIGFYISGHPLDKYEKLLAGKYTQIESLENLEKGSVVNLAGAVSGLQVKKTKNGNYMAIFNLIDKSGIVEVVAFPDVYEEFGEKIKEDKVVVVKGQIDEDMETESLKVIAREFFLPEEISKNGNGYFTIRIRREDALNGKLEALKKLLEKFRDEEGVQVVFHVVGRDFKAVLQPPPDLKVNPSPELMEILQSKLNMRPSV